MLDVWKIVASVIIRIDADHEHVISLAHICELFGEVCRDDDRDLSLLVVHKGPGSLR